MKVIKPEDNNKASYLLDMPFCRIPHLNPYDDSIMHLIQPDIYVQCNEKLSLTYQDGDMIHVNWSAVERSGYRDTFAVCFYNPIYRPQRGKRHNYFRS